MFKYKQNDIGQLRFSLRNAKEASTMIRARMTIKGQLYKALLRFILRRLPDASDNFSTLRPLVSNTGRGAFGLSAWSLPTRLGGTNKERGK